MSREIMRVTVVAEYPVDPDRYPESSTPAERAEIDRKNFENDPEVLLSAITDPDPKATSSIRVTAITVA